MSSGDPDTRTLRVLGALPFTWGWRGGDGAGDSRCRARDETQLCHWSQHVTGMNWCFLPAVLGGTLLQQSVHMSTRPLNIYKATDDVEMLGKRLRRFPKPSAHWPCCKPLLSGCWNSWQRQHRAMACTEQTEDTPRGNKVNSSLKNPPHQNKLPKPLSLPRSDRAAQRL